MQIEQDYGPSTRSINVHLSLSPRPQMELLDLELPDNQLIKYNVTRQAIDAGA